MSDEKEKVIGSRCVDNRGTQPTAATSPNQCGLIGVQLEPKLKEVHNRALKQCSIYNKEIGPDIGHKTALSEANNLEVIVKPFKKYDSRTGGFIWKSGYDQPYRIYIHAQTGDIYKHAMIQRVHWYLEKRGISRLEMHPNPQATLTYLDPSTRQIVHKRLTIHEEAMERVGLKTM